MTFILTFWRLTYRRCAALGRGLLALATRRTGALADRENAANLRASRYLIFVFALVAAGLVGAGILYFRHHEKLQRENLEHQLSTIAELKTADLAQWRAERLTNANFLSRSGVFAESVRHAFANPQDRQSQERLHRWLRELREEYSYEHVYLFDAQGVGRVSVPAQPVPADETSLAREVLRAGQVALMDFHRDAPGEAIELSLMVPLLGEKKGSPPVGLLYMGIDPANYLYPFIQRWHTPSDTGETLLVRREGDEVVFLNELRFRKNSALALREPLTRTELPAVKAALGHEGIAEGVDYRGVPVIASMRPVPGSPWFLIAKIDKAEALAPAQATLWLVAGLVSALFLALAAGVSVLWWHQRLRSAKAQLRAANMIATASSRYRAVAGSTNDAIITADSAGTIVGWNAAAERIFGYTETEIVGQPLTLVIPDRYRDGHLDGIKRMQAGGKRHVIGKSVELHGLTKAGREFPLELALSEWETSSGRFFAGIIRDITERKQREHELIDSEQRFRGLVEQSIAGIYIIQDGKFAYVNTRFAEIRGFRSADELIGRDPMPLIAEKDRGAMAENNRRLLAGEARNIAFSFTALREDGSTVEVGLNARCAAYRDRPAIIGMIQDISEKKHAEEQNQRFLAQMESAFMSTVQVATNLSEMRDPYTTGHSRRVGEIAAGIGAELGFDAHRQEGLRVAGYLHDIGKITIPTEILAKPGRLDPIEYDLVMEHAQASYDILKDVEFPWPVAEVALQHHERVDGSGYPQGLKGEATLIDARIMAVADVVEAMSSHRPYRPGLGIDKALAEIERGRGSVYDAVVADACLRLFRQKPQRSSELTRSLLTELTQ